ncbi:MAG: hypothetical protein IPH13_20525 [Planctomycetes bacterium]|nr:hypothetical protein [Planctomycetota bacterium]
MSHAYQAYAGDLAPPYYGWYSYLAEVEFPSYTWMRADGTSRARVLMVTTTPTRPRALLAYSDVVRINVVPDASTRLLTLPGSSEELVLSIMQADPEYFSEAGIGLYP